MRERALAIWRAGLAATRGDVCVEKHIAVDPTQLVFGPHGFPSGDFDRLWVFGAGKAAGWMAAGLESRLRHEPSWWNRLRGQVHVPDAPQPKLDRISVHKLRPRGRNLPTEHVISASQRVLEYLREAGSRDLCVFLISGGASALWEVLRPGVSLNEFCQLTQRLQDQGMPIDDLNRVRRQLSELKGGGLVAAATPAACVAMVLSDIVGDPPDLIGSGPAFVSPDPTEGLAAMVASRLGARESLPRSIRTALETPPASHLLSEDLSSCPHLVVANLPMAVEAAVAEAERLGYQARGQVWEREGTVAEMARRMVNAVDLLRKSGQRQCLIWGGEPDMVIPGTAGQGGRNLHLLLTAMAELQSGNQGWPRNVCIASVSTDGEDGTAPASGAIAEGGLEANWDRAGGLAAARAALACFDSFPFLNACGAIVPEETTRTNVGDLRLILYDGESPAPP